MKLPVNHISVFRTCSKILRVASANCAKKTKIIIPSTRLNLMRCWNLCRVRLMINLILFGIRLSIFVMTEAITF